MGPADNVTRNFPFCHLIPGNGKRHSHRPARLRKAHSLFVSRVRLLKWQLAPGLRSGLSLQTVAPFVLERENRVGPLPWVQRRLILGFRLPAIAQTLLHGTRFPGCGADFRLVPAHAGKRGIMEFSSWDFRKCIGDPSSASAVKAHQPSPQASEGGHVLWMIKAISSMGRGQGLPFQFQVMASGPVSLMSSTRCRLAMRNTSAIRDPSPQRINRPP